MDEWVLWVLATASALHVVEEHALGWQGWAARALAPRLGVVPSWSDFWATNAALIVLAVSASAVGWAAPGFSLAFPALCLINAVGFHLLPSIAERRPNPGFFTAMLLYVPIGIVCYVVADSDGVLDLATLLVSLAAGAVIMASVVAILALSGRFRYPDAAEAGRL